MVWTRERAKNSMRRCRWMLNAGLLLAMGLWIRSADAGRVIDLYTAKPGVLVVHSMEVPLWFSSTLTQVTTAANYSIRSPDDAAYSSATTPDALKHKRKVLHNGAYNQTEYVSSAEFWLVLLLPSPLESGKTYTLTANGSVSSVVGFADTTFVFNEKRMYSEAIHVNSVGFLSDASMKYAYVSHILGEAGGMVYANNTPFHLLNTATDRYVFSGTLSERASGTGDYKTRIWQCDFSSFATPGEYRVVVDGIGCSYPFEIGADGYRKAFQAAARGLFHHRCGIEITEEHSRWVKPRCHHSDDIPAYQTTSEFVNDNAEALKEKATTERIDCWGGWHDAGDHDHYETHLKIPFMLFAAYEINPDGCGDGEMTIPESGNGIPDILDEARWGVDLWKRMQKADGGVPAYTTPYPGGGCLYDATAIYASVPTSGSSLMYAGMAAAMGYFLNKLGKTTEAAEYISSAKKSYGYPGGGTPRAAAALWLWRATGESSYHSDFVANRPSYKKVWNESDRLETYVAAGYVLAPEARSSVSDTYRTEIVNAAESYISEIRADAMRVSKRGLNWMGGYTLPGTMALPLAYRLTGDTKYRDHHALVCDYYLGGNPLNMTWVSGLGEKSPENLLHVQTRRMWAPDYGLPVPTGIVPYGPAAYYRNSDNNWCTLLDDMQNTCYPKHNEWSIAELWFEWPASACTNEYTVHQTIGPAVFAYSGLCDNKVSSAWDPYAASVRVHDEHRAPTRLQAPVSRVSISRVRGTMHISAPTAVRVVIYDTAGRRLTRSAPATSHAVSMDRFGSGPRVVSVVGCGVRHTAMIGACR